MMDSIVNFNEFINEVLQNNSRNYKLQVLEKYKNNETIKYYLHFIYSPYTITGISDKKLSKELDSVDVNEFADTKDLLEYLIKNNTGKDTDISKVQSFRNKLSEEYRDLFNQIVTKNLQLGVDTKSINKVIPNCIEVFEVQLANKYFDRPEIVEGKDFVLTLKIDGMRCIAMKDNNGQVSFWSRQGQPIDGLVDLEEEMSKWIPNNTVFDGELVAIVDNPDTYKDTMKRARNKNTEKHGLKMKVFDYLPLNEFMSQTCSTPYMGRRFQMMSLIDPLNNEIEVNGELYKPKFFEMLPILYQGTDTSIIIELLNDLTDRGEEGLMINIADAYYEYKRCNTLLKVKKFQDTELIVTGYEEGTNKYVGKLGALICEYKGNEVKVGGGYTDQEREEIWNERDSWIGRKITVKYFEETKNDNGGVSLRFPVFVGERIDL